MIPDLQYPHEMHERAAEEASKDTGIVDPLIASLLHSLIVANRSIRVLEIGTYTGCTTLWLAHAVQVTGGLMTSIDRDDFRGISVAEARLNIAGLRDRVKFVVSDAYDALVQIHRQEQSPLPDGWFDFAFLDGPHDIPNLDRLFGRVMVMLDPGGLLCMHDCAMSGDICGESEWLAAHVPHAIRMATENQGLAIIQKGWA